MLAHAHVLAQTGYETGVVAGRGDASALPPQVDLHLVPEIDSRHPDVARINPALEQGEVPPEFEGMTGELEERLRPLLRPFDNLIVHNVFTKHFNLPLTAALFRLLDGGAIRNCIAWCHDFTWTSSHSRSKVHPGYPWDLLRTPHPDVTYVTVSEHRRRELAGLFEWPPERIPVVYNGVDPQELLGLSDEGWALVERLDLLAGDVILLMPVRVTQAKNIEYALRVVAALKETGSRPRLVLTGPPDPHDEESMAYFRSLQELRARLDVEEEMRFVFESGPDSEEPFTVGMHVVGDLFRVSDVMFMPSHREGFGMPVLEAGLVGIPVVCTDVPAAEEIGREDVVRFSADERAADVAARIVERVARDPAHRLRRRVRRRYTWRAIFHRDIEPLLT
jgi:glycosyltransferase involved in cell wall biosynthesis